MGHDQGKGGCFSLLLSQVKNRSPFGTCVLNVTINHIKLLFTVQIIWNYCNLIENLIISYDRREFSNAAIVHQKETAWVDNKERKGEDKKKAGG